MNKLYILTIAAFLTPTYPASANPVQDKDDIQIRREDVDINRDGIVSTEEAKSYIKNLEDEYREELERQKIKIKELKIPEIVKKETAISKPIVTNNEAPAADSKITVKEKETDKKVSPSIQKKYDRRTEEMKAFDMNKDGILQPHELQRSAQTKFDAADTNKDGVLSPEETAASVEKFKTNKQEDYGKAAVKQQANRIKNRFNNSDANEDGIVSKEEYGTYMMKHQQNFDRNGDGVISKEEYRTDGEKLPSSYVKKPKED